jgi:hypothetical protein
MEDSMEHQDQIDPLAAEQIEAAATLLGLSARIRPGEKLRDHKDFSRLGLALLYSGGRFDCVEIEAAIETAARQEGIN